jgi:hypothetical protein
MQINTYMRPNILQNGHEFQWCAAISRRFPKRSLLLNSMAHPWRYPYPYPPTGISNPATGYIQVQYPLINSSWFLDEKPINQPTNGNIDENMALSSCTFFRKPLVAHSPSSARRGLAPRHKSSSSSSQLHRKSLERIAATLILPIPTITRKTG